jgi:nitrilase
MPLARMAIYQQGVQVYIAPTADARDTWPATMQHIACEGRFSCWAATSSSAATITREFRVSWRKTRT